MMLGEVSLCIGWRINKEKFKITSVLLEKLQNSSSFLFFTWCDLLLDLSSELSEIESKS